MSIAGGSEGLTGIPSMTPDISAGSMVKAVARLIAVKGIGASLLADSSSLQVAGWLSPESGLFLVILLIIVGGPMARYLEGAM